MGRPNISKGGVNRSFQIKERPPRPKPLRRANPAGPTSIVITEDGEEMLRVATGTFGGGPTVYTNAAGWKVTIEAPPL